MNMRRAFITGIAGQDGSYLSEYLLTKGYQVIGLVIDRSYDMSRISHNKQSLTIEYGNVCNTTLMLNLIKKYQPTEIYNLASESFVPSSWAEPLISADVTAIGVTSMLEAFRVGAPHARFFQASSSEMYGKTNRSPQNEKVAFRPISPYGVSKAYGHFMTASYRKHYHLYACSGIMYNHESIRRDPKFVSRKITLAAARIKLGLQNSFNIGSVDASRDWGYAGDYVEAMWMLLQNQTPKDYVIATGKLHTVKQLLDCAFSSVDLDWKKYAIIDQSLFRSPERTKLVGDPSRIENDLGWKPKVSFEEMICEMVNYDLKNNQILKVA